MKRGFTLLTVLALAATLVTGCTVSETPDLGSTPDNSISEQTAVSDTQEPTSEATSTPDLPSGMGMLKVFVTDPPPPKMDAIWVNITSLEVHKTGGNWTTVVQNPSKFNLKAIEDRQQYLASKIVTPGKYTQIRLEVDQVRIVVGEDEYFARVPSGKIKLVGTFEVVENNTTEITLDFNGERSVHVTGKGDYIFKPVIKLLAERPRSEGPKVKYPAPTVTSVNPNSGNQGETIENIIITGANFTDAKAVSFGANININDFTVNSNTQVTTNITIAIGAIPGARDVSVTTPKGTGTLADGFRVISGAPVVTSVNPDSGKQGETIENVIITGANLTGATAVSFGANININDFTVNSNNQVTTNITIAIGAIPGARDVSVTTPKGTGMLDDGFRVISVAPIVERVDPDSGKRKQTLDVIITGSNFTGDAEVSFGEDIKVNSVTFDDITQVTANITIAVNAKLGARDVSVTTPKGTGTLTGGFTVETP